MAALVTAPLGAPKRLFGVMHAGPTKVADAVETDLSTPSTAVVFDTRGVTMLQIYAKFANYTGVTVKAQRSLDGTNYVDVASATTSTTNTCFVFDPQAPWIRLSIAGTLSAGADTLEVWAYAEYMR